MIVGEGREEYSRKTNSEGRARGEEVHSNSSGNRLTPPPTPHGNERDDACTGPIGAQGSLSPIDRSRAEDRDDDDGSRRGERE